jgi:hypothetical protein
VEEAAPVLVDNKNIAEEAADVNTAAEAADVNTAAPAGSNWGKGRHIELTSLLPFGGGAVLVAEAEQAYAEELSALSDDHVLEVQLCTL